MSELRYNKIACDGCPKIFEHEDEIGPTDSSRAIRRCAKEHGWTRRTRSRHQKFSGDFCPECSAKLPPTPTRRAYKRLKYPDIA